MSTQTNHGGPVFPTPYSDSAPGMTLREYYAGQAMAAILASPRTFNGCKELEQQEVANLAVWMAEALIERLGPLAKP